MRRVLTIASQKGGVGKTTTALNLAYSFGRLGGRVLLFDLDPQSGLTIATNLRRKTKSGLVDYIKAAASADEIRAVTKDGVLTIVGIGNLAAAEIGRYERAAWDGTLKKAVNELSRGYDAVVIDAPAGVGGVVRAMLELSHGVVLVLNCRAITLKSLPAFLSLLKDVAEKTNPTLRLEGVLASMVDSRSPAEDQFLAQLRTMMPDLLLRHLIPHAEIVEQASSKCLPLALVEGGEELARIYLELAIELRERELAQARPQADDDDIGLF